MEIVRYMAALIKIKIRNRAKMNKYIITVESDTPPQLMLGERVAGAVIVEIKKDSALATAAQLATYYGVSTKTIRQKLAGINEGTSGKGLYNPTKAAEIMRTAHKRGRKRLN